MPDTLNEIRERDSFWIEGQSPATLAADRRALLAHIDALTAAVRRWRCRLAVGAMHVEAVRR